MICPKCSYAMDAFDRECPRCHGKGISAPSSASRPPIPSPTPVASSAPVRPVQSVGCLPIFGAFGLCLVALVGGVLLLGPLASYLIVFGTSCWVLIDAQNTERGRVQGFLDMSPWGWFFGCLLLWIIIFPCYLATRPLIINNA